tara:strand:- start:2661 stop:3536 length:876 start_codon:yes stop_codon:yes gene_type:complete
MKNLNIFCFGFGQVAKNFIKKIKLENFNINLTTTSRSKTHKEKFNGISYTSFELNQNNYDQKLIEKLLVSDHILVSIPPINGTDLVFKNFSKIIENSNSKWITYLSATNVYGDHKGKWVNENSELRPNSLKGKLRLVTENLWLSLYLKKKIPLQIFRLSGIYSNENNILKRLISGNIKIIKKKNHFFSRIHVDDISNILFSSLTKFKSGEIFNISDDKPASLEDVIMHGVKILGAKKPKNIKIEDIQNENLKNFYKETKKVNNKKMKVFFNYNLKFPTYAEGLNYIKDHFK